MKCSGQSVSNTNQDIFLEFQFWIDWSAQGLKKCLLASKSWIVFLRYYATVK